MMVAECPGCGRTDVRVSDGSGRFTKGAMFEHTKKGPQWECYFEARNSGYTLCPWGGQRAPVVREDAS